MKPKKITKFSVEQKERENSVVIYLDGQAFVLGRSVALLLTKRLQEVACDWSFRYLSGCEQVDKVT